jgi:hypothetical protein
MRKTMPKDQATLAANICKHGVGAAALAAVLVFFGVAAPAAQDAPKSEAPAKVEPAPELAPGIAPGVVPGARPGGTEPQPQPGIAPGVVPGAKPGGADAGPPVGAGNHPAFAPSPVTPDQNAAVEFSPSAVIGSPDWPCIQRKVMTISPAQIWDGPPIDGIKDFDPAVRDLTEILESRRVPSEEAEKAIKEYGAKFPEGPERDKKLTELFASFLEQINSDRQFVMSKVEEFQKRQKARAAELEREGQKLAEKGIAATDELLPTETQLTPEQQEYNWNARIFQERQQNLTMACEIPVLIEQRAYEIARLIRAQMKG